MKFVVLGPIRFILHFNDIFLFNFYLMLTFAVMLLELLQFGAEVYRKKLILPVKFSVQELVIPGGITIPCTGRFVAQEPVIPGEITMPSVDSLSKSE
jgi:hypothetical protein